MPNKITNALKQKTLYHKRILLRKISPDFFGPDILRIYPVGYLCNHSCPMCWRSNNVSSQEKRKLIRLEKKSLTIDEYQKVFATLPPATNTVDIVGGGEPLIYPQIKELTNLIKKRNLYGTLITNGVLLKSDLINHLLSINWDHIRISIHASNPDIYKLINGVNHFQTVLSNIRSFMNLRQKRQNQSKNKTRIGVLSVIQKQNYQDVYDFALLAQKLRCDYVEFDPLCPYGDSMKLDSRELEQTLIQLKSIRKNIHIPNNVTEVIHLYHSQPHISLENIDASIYYRLRKCVIPTDSMTLDSLGETHPCCHLDNSEPENIACGDFRKVGSLWNIWREKKYIHIRKNLRKGIFYRTCLSRCTYDLSMK